MDYKYNKRKHDSITHKRKHDLVIYVFFSYRVIMAYPWLSRRHVRPPGQKGKKNSVSRGSTTIVMLEQRRIKAI